MILETRDHLDSFTSLSPVHLAEFGPLVAAVERCLLDLGNVSRVHVSRWGDGSAHFHVFVYPRPQGHLQLRGTFLSIWELLLPPADSRKIRRVEKQIAAGMRAQYPELPSGRVYALPLTVDGHDPAEVVEIMERVTGHRQDIRVVPASQAALAGPQSARVGSDRCGCAERLDGGEPGPGERGDTVREQAMPLMRRHPRIAAADQPHAGGAHQVGECEHVLDATPLSGLERRAVGMHA
jgi:hypothetical protein